MIKTRLLIIPIILACFLVVGCTTDKAWRKATVSSYEILGVGIGGTPGIVETLKTQNAITDEQVAKVKVVYNKAKAIYKLLGDSLKLASSADTEAKKETALQDYNKLLSDFNALLVELNNLINSFKKVSMLEIYQWVTEGGALWLNS